MSQFQLVPKGGRLSLVLRCWTPLPAALCRRSDVYETEMDGRVRVRVEIRHPFAGLVVRCRGRLMAEPRRSV
jgi:Domain of unknown function (DUF4166)